MTRQTPSAISPHHSATVSASAGTGKTWLLVGRLIRLLLAGADPAGILAITFTRKAAAEMQTRLAARLLGFAHANEASLVEQLGQIGAPSDRQTLVRARQLYEQLLQNPHPIKSATFHAFCQDILRRFPLEAGVAPGFELAESTAELQMEAWDALCAEANQYQDGETAQAIETLMETCGGLSNTQNALHAFLRHRSDWWAFTENQAQPLAFAAGRLQKQLKIRAEEDPVAAFYTAETRMAIKDYAQLLQRHVTKTNEKNADILFRLMEGTILDDEAFDALCGVFLTKAKEIRTMKDSKPRRKAMGDDGEARFLELHQTIGEGLQQTLDRLAALQTLHRTLAWYTAGERLLDYFQRLKAEQRVLDFADLEWKAYRLLNHSDNAHWVQYKLDQRIDHLLIDEFQDTNPTQWRMVLPLLEELAAGENPEGRSVFLVGDNKQSIYRFRRADPELFNEAQSWVRSHLDAVSQPLNTSWRSSPAIMDFVNLVFGSGPLHGQIQAFSTHTTHHEHLWGKAAILPLIQKEEEVETPEVEVHALRNPLHAPRLIPQDQRHWREGQLIANTIRSLMENAAPVGEDKTARPLRYGDIMILLRQRTHVADLEKALREADIPYSGANRGTLLESLEVQDMQALLECLVTPFNNLALGQVLRSPLFSCREDHLALLAKQGQGHWLDALFVLGPEQDAKHPLHRAARLLQQWQQRAAVIPVHDLLDGIFCEGDVMRRYRAAYPAHLQFRVTANLTRFLELALEIDSGRYPSLGHFVARLHALQQRDDETPDEGTPTQVSDRVRIMTIHASKGLEAPVVFLADAANEKSAKTSGQAIIHWPTQEAQPESFLLAGKKAEQDAYTRHILELHAKAEAREDANLLYVALTRARQMLFISGCRPNRGEQLGWYGLMAGQCAQGDPAHGVEDIIEQGWQRETGQPPPLAPETRAEAPLVDISEDLTQPLHVSPRDRFLVPSRQSSRNVPARQGGETGFEAEEEGRVRGMAIHRMLQLLCEGQENIPGRVANELSLGLNHPDLANWFHEAKQVLDAPHLKHLFHGAGIEKAFNEVPLQYEIEGERVYGIIDRLVVTSGEVYLLDYKSHRINDPSHTGELKTYYQPQMDYYRRGVQRLWPDKTVHCGLVLTHQAVWLDM
jgi:ATP-dependent helicase/nuclease subunit A